MSMYRDFIALRHTIEIQVMLLRLSWSDYDVVSLECQKLYKQAVYAYVVRYARCTKKSHKNTSQMKRK